MLRAIGIAALLILRIPANCAEIEDLDQTPHQILRDAEIGLTINPSLKQKSCSEFRSFLDCKKAIREFDKVRLNPPPQLEIYQSACREGDSYSCAIQAYERSFRRSVEVTPFDFDLLAQSIARMKPLCDVGEVAECHALALAHERGLGVRESWVQALKFLNIACSMQYPPACASIAMKIVSGERRAGLSEINPITLATKYCIGKFSKLGCLASGLARLRNSEMADADPSAKYALVIACKEGSLKACSVIGWMYDNGKGLPQKREKAITFWNWTCRRGEEDGCRNLASRILANGANELRAKEELEAEKLFLQACESGEGGSCFRAAELASKRIGKVTSAEILILQDGCRFNNMDCCEKLARSTESSETQRLFAQKRASLLRSLASERP